MTSQLRRPDAGLLEVQRDLCSYGLGLAEATSEVEDRLLARAFPAQRWTRAESEHCGNLQVEKLLEASWLHLFAPEDLCIVAFCHFLSAMLDTPVARSCPVSSFSVDQSGLSTIDAQHLLHPTAVPATVSMEVRQHPSTFSASRESVSVGLTWKRFEHGEDVEGARVQLFQQAKLVTRGRSSINGPPKIGASCDCCVITRVNGILEKLVETYWRQTQES